MSDELELDDDKIDEVALALMWLGVHGDKHETRVWKGMAWEITDRLHDRGWISNPRTSAKSVRLTEEGERLAGEFLEKHFARRGDAQ